MINIYEWIGWFVVWFLCCPIIVCVTLWVTADLCLWCLNKLLSTWGFKCALYDYIRGPYREIANNHWTMRLWNSIAERFNRPRRRY